MIRAVYNLLIWLTGVTYVKIKSASLGHFAMVANSECGIRLSEACGSARIEVGVDSRCSLSLDDI